MALKDFDLDLTARKTTDSDAEPQLTSASGCTPGCVTGILMTCPLQSATCGCHIGG